nr:pentatricopeptide repeat-containing protein At1g26900, mitochondrial isoform X1 [Ziziphus jujuba var. spinosa]XP_048318625.1 pentatricopeptide repeat-containing protein At1g26900, mitochondrial isoform X1 [Ziziphus jujuba var. spinosa]
MTLRGASSFLRQNFKFWSEMYKSDDHLFFPKDLNFISLLKSCKQISQVSQVHGFMVKSGLDHDPFTLSKLLASSIQDIEYAASIFNSIQNPNLFMFNTMLRGYSASDVPEQAFVVFNNLRAQGIVLDQFSFITTLKACAVQSNIWTGQVVHGIALKSGYRLFINVKNTLLHLYCICGRILDAHVLFDEFPQQNDLVSYNTLMGGYLHISQPIVIVELFRKLCSSGLKASITTMLSVLSAAGDLGNYLGGESLHGYCIKLGFCSDLHVVTALTDMYAKTDHIDLAHRIFNEVTLKDVVLWNCLIDKHAKSGLLEEALALLKHLKLEGLKANSSTLAGLLSTCASSGAVSMGRCINNYVEEEGLVLDVVLGTALVDMYAKCGFLGKATDIFERMQGKDVKSWTAMISGYGNHGQAENAIRLFCRMEDEGYKPNEITFLAILSACSHGGLVTEGMRYFEIMVSKYGFLPKIEHYGCIIDLLGRAGLLEEAYKLLKSLPVKGDATAWRALLAACRVFGYVELGECVERVLIDLNDEHPTNSILLSSAYAVAGRLPERSIMQEIKEEERLMKDMKFSFRYKDKIAKEVGCSTIEMDFYLYNQQ